MNEAERLALRTGATQMMNEQRFYDYIPTVLQLYRAARIIGWPPVIAWEWACRLHRIGNVKVSEIIDTLTLNGIHQPAEFIVAMKKILKASNKSPP